MLRVVRTLLLLVCSLALPAAAWAQAALAGNVTDSSGALLPGVTVEAASPALIEKVRSAVTDGNGRYRIEDLRPGTYSVTFTLPGFSTVKRDELAVGGSAVISVDAQMDHAASTQVHDPAEGIRLWQRVEDASLAQAPIIPAFNSTFVTLLSARTGNYQFNPQWGILLSQLWVR